MEPEERHNRAQSDSRRAERVKQKSRIFQFPAVRQFLVPCKWAVVASYQLLPQLSIIFVCKAAERKPLSESGVP